MSQGKVIKCRAAVAWNAEDPLKVEEIEVDPPKTGEVRIKIIATGICHSDLSAAANKMMGVQYPLVVGHEASGIVESIGDGVESVKPGDHVITLFLPQCRKCRVCLNKNSNACLQFMGAQLKGVMQDGTSRMTCRGEKLYTFVGCSTFAEYTVCSEMNVSKINPEAPLDKVCLLSCGISTGYGSAVNTAGVTKGSTVAVWGLGALGLAAVMGSKTAGAKTIIGIDINPSKFEIAKELGATDFINPKDLSVPIEQYIMGKYDGGADYTFECVGQIATMTQAFESCALGNGVCVLIGVGEATALMNISPGHFLLGKTLKGSLFGAYKSRDAVPKLVDDFMDGKFNIDKFITHHITLDEINEGFDLLKSGKSIRTIIKF